ncbi:MAG: DNA polymerase III subunit beta [Clostridia bacterium]|nr:DNA polymerase III subunit beta [Clostridia bacterium]
MNLKFNKNTLLNIINTVQKAVTAKSVMPILECIKIDAFQNGNVIITGNNLDICIEYESSCEVIEAGSIAISSKMFGEIIRRFPDEDVFIKVNPMNNVMTLKCGNSEFDIQGLNSEEYPAIPEVKEEYIFNIKQSQLKRMIRKTVFAISNNESKKPILTGSLFEIETGVLTVVSTDGFRIAKIESIVDSSLNDIKFVIPGITLRELMKVLEENDENVEIMVSKRNVKFCFENYTVVSRLLEGEYIRYKPIFNTPNTIVVTVNTRIFTDSLERAALIINDDALAKTEKVPVRLNISQDKIEIDCKTGKAKINDEVPANIIGGEIEIGFNHRYLLEALRSCEDEEIKLELSNPKSSCFIKPTENNDYIYMILPVRLYED